MSLRIVFVLRYVFWAGDIMTMEAHEVARAVSAERASLKALVAAGLRAVPVALDEHLLRLGGDLGLELPRELDVALQLLLRELGLLLRLLCRRAVVAARGSTVVGSTLPRLPTNASDSAAWAARC